MNAYLRPRLFAGHLAVSVASGLMAIGLTTSAQAHGTLKLTLILALFGLAVSPMYVWKGSRPPRSEADLLAPDAPTDPYGAHKLISLMCLTGAAGMVLLGLAGGAFGGLLTLLLTLIGGSYAYAWVEHKIAPTDEQAPQPAQVVQPTRASAIGSPARVARRIVSPTPAARQDSSFGRRRS